MKKILTILLFLSPWVVFADEICDAAMAEGKQLYQKGDYVGAKKSFEYVQAQCGGNYNVTPWINKCKAALTPTLSLSTYSLSADAAGRTAHISVTGNRAWEIEYDSGDMYQVTRSGDGVDVVISANSGDSRSDYFLINSTDSKVSKRVNLSQDAYPIRLSTNTIEATFSGTTKHIQVACTLDWQIVGPSGTMYQVTRSGDGVDVRIYENTNTSPRHDYFEITTLDRRFSERVQMTQAPHTSSVKSKNNPTYSWSATIHKVWADYNADSNGRKGVKIHVELTAQNMKGLVGQCSAWFCDKNGYELKGKTSRTAYVNYQGYVWAWNTFAISSNDPNWKYVTLFMPYSEIPQAGSLKFYITIHEKSTGTNLAASDYYSFTLTR